MVLGHFGHGHFGLGRFGLDISATDVSATENAEGGHFGHNHKFWVWDMCMHKCVMYFIIFWNQMCMWILTVDSKLHDNKSMLFSIETCKLWCILYSSEWLWNTSCIKYPLPELECRTKHPGTKHPMPFFVTPDKTSRIDLPPRTKHPMQFLSPRTKHPMPFLPPRTKHPMPFLPPWTKHPTLYLKPNERA